MSRRDEKPTFDERLLVAGLDAINAGDAEGAADALRLAREIQETAEKNTARRKKHG